MVIQAVVNHHEITESKDFNGFVEGNGYVSMEAEHFSRNISVNGVRWKVIPDLGRTLSAVAAFPVKSPVQVPGNNCPRIEYDIYLFQSGKADVTLYLSPSLNYFNDDGLKIAVSFDDQEPQILAFNKDDKTDSWNEWVSNNMIKVASSHQLAKAGKHTLKIWMVTPGAVLQKIVMHSENEKPSYLGEPESAIRSTKYQLKNRIK